MSEHPDGYIRIPASQVLTAASAVVMSYERALAAWEKTMTAKLVEWRSSGALWRRALRRMNRIPTDPEKLLKWYKRLEVLAWHHDFLGREPPYPYDAKKWLRIAKACPPDTSILIDAKQAAWIYNWEAQFVHGQARYPE